MLQAGREYSTATAPPTGAPGYRRPPDQALTKLLLLFKGIKGIFEAYGSSLVGGKHSWITLPQK